METNICIIFQDGDNKWMKNKQPPYDPQPKIKDNPKYDVYIDFKQSEKEWMKNKVYTSAPVMNHNSSEYRCGFIKKNGEPCRGHPHHWKRSVRPKNTKCVYDWGFCSYQRTSSK